MPATVDIGTLIYKDPAMHSGRPCIAGTGTTVLAVDYLYNQGLSPKQITEELPLSLASVFAALAYVTANRDEIDGYLREDEEAYAEGVAEQAARAVS
ncbi:MAG: DUF433 domain-containing protein [Dehalococcoidia bacterium]